MIINSATPLAFMGGCLTAIATLQTARAQIGGTAPGSYWTSPGAYGYRPLQLPRQAPMRRSACTSRRRLQTAPKPSW